jgi:hypothetical protein
LHCLKYGIISDEKWLLDEHFAACISWLADLRLQTGRFW